MNAGKPRQQLTAARWIELAHHVVEHQHRPFTQLVAHDGQLGQADRQRSGALLPLRAEGAHLARVYGEQHLVAVRTDGGAQAAQICLSRGKQRIQLRLHLFPAAHAGLVSHAELLAPARDVLINILCRDCQLFHIFRAPAGQLRARLGQLLIPHIQRTAHG